MNDDWRLQIDFVDEGPLDALQDRLDAEELEHDHEAERFADRFRAEDLPVAHRWKYVLIGAVDEEHAKELAERIRDEAPAGSEVAAQGTWAAAYAERPRSPFSFLGGLAE
jgi:hypothetical protein